jgi:hypothetical protein
MTRDHHSLAIIEMGDSPAGVKLPVCLGAVFDPGWQSPAACHANGL